MVTLVETDVVGNELRLPLRFNKKLSRARALDLVVKQGGETRGPEFES